MQLQLGILLPIAGAVLILLAALIMSYRQIIYAYPKGGGAYMVSKTNLGENGDCLQEAHYYRLHTDCRC